MGQLTRPMLLTILIIVLNYFQISDACSCMYEHPQTKFCKEDWVAIVRIVNNKQINESRRAYQVKVNRILKASSNARIALKENVVWVYTPTSDIVCGLSLEHFEKPWVLGGQILGDKLSTTLCNLHIYWPQTTPIQRKGFRLLYQNGCNCQVAYIQWSQKSEILEKTGGNQCLWESEPGPTSCQERYGICNRGSEGCYWQPRSLYNKCIKKHQHKSKPAIKVRASRN